MLINSAELLAEAIRSRMPHADDNSVDVLTAVTGLLGAITYMDRKVSPEEIVQLKEQLGRLHGLDAEGVSAIADILGENAMLLSTRFTQRFGRTLREELPEVQRVEVLGALLSIAASDGHLSVNEVNSLRSLTSLLGLTQAHYNELQQLHRDKLSLRP